MNIRLHVVGVLCLALVIEIVTTNVRLQRSPKNYCGSGLADILKILCYKKGYNDGKRSHMDLEKIDYTQLEAGDEMGSPYLSNENAMAFIPPRLLRSPTVKIVDECCNKPCTIYELKGYCAS